MGKKPAHIEFPSVNLLLDRERIRRDGRPTVRARFLVALAISIALLIIAAGIQLMPALAVPR